ncbi:putative tagatose-6-phosphate ketose/aldose isomerase [Echinicola pacifica]|uniref:Tagatose-6-phosphate ketose/aldose isomerase n=1 Tax=Echinicola pacifica TaxID=346377 RepID=A0A918UXL2_9BACT|nr:SIS domain-containing protein [Echinicola pacifica]GGZ41151.1 putative tagatose-6-phosphate ketose/aldose isomerase [Echinicola pacifica]
MIETSYLNLGVEEVRKSGAEHTAREISGQPALWEDVYELVLSQSNALDGFMDNFLSKAKARVILTGAGSSAFIGESAQGPFQKMTGVLTQAIATTDLVTHPELFFIKDAPTLLVSFARSGNSPESVEAVRLADQHISDIYHLIITCNPEGKLAEYASECGGNCHAVVLPKEANDVSLAMTGSFTSMLLTALLVSAGKERAQLKGSLEAAIAVTDDMLTNRLGDFLAVAQREFKRVIFLGSGPMLGIARECHLKLQELTDGEVVCKHDSFLGFRHGPKAVANEESIVVYLLSSDPHVAKYEEDLVGNIAADKRSIATISFGATNGATPHSILKIDSEKQNSTGYFNVLPATLMGQLLGFYKCLEMGLQPDNPSTSGAISRVVQGVKIYSK